MKTRRYLYALSGILLLIVAVAGWFAVDRLGDNARQQVIKENRAAASVVSIHVSSELTGIERAVKALSGSPLILPALLARGAREIEYANNTLDRYNSALNASVSYVMDINGMTVASSNRRDPDSFLGKSYHFRPYFQEAAKGQSARYFAWGFTSGKRGFYAGYPVEDRSGKVVGVVAVKKDLDDMETFFSEYTFCFLVSPEGIIFLSSMPSMVLKSLWPLDEAARGKLIASRQFGDKISEVSFHEEKIADGMEVTLEGENYFVSRTLIDSGGWSIVLLTPTGRIMTYRWIGILATISAGLLILIFSGVIHITERSREVIRQSEELYRSLTEKSIAGVYVVQDGKFRFMNSYLASHTGYAKEELLGREAGLLIFPEDGEKVRQHARAMLFGETSTPYEFRIITKQGEARWILETVTFIMHEGRPAILGNSMDITKRKRAEEALRESESLLRAITDSAQDAILMMDPEGRISYWNPAAERMLGHTSAEAIGQKLHEFIAPLHYHGAYHAAFPAFRQRGQGTAVGRTTDLEARRKDGREISVQLSLSAIHMKGAWHAVGILRDITDRKQTEEMIRQMAHHDFLTGLPNRKLFSDRLAIALAQAPRNQKGVAVVMLDLDNFKGVNDTLGHDVGDLLLKAAAERLSAALRKGDTVARFGGDEFVLILPDLKGIEDAIRVAQKIVDGFRNPFLIDLHKLTVTTSIGVAVYPHDGTDEASLLKNADIAMYQAKQAGRDRYRIFKSA